MDVAGYILSTDGVEVAGFVETAFRPG